MRSCVSPSPVAPIPFAVEFLLPFLEWVFPRLSVLSLDLVGGNECKLEFTPFDSPRKTPSTRLIPPELSIGIPFINPLPMVGWEEVSVEARCGGSYTELSLESKWTGSLTCLERTDGIVVPRHRQNGPSQHAPSAGRGSRSDRPASYVNNENGARMSSSLIESPLPLSSDV